MSTTLTKKEEIRPFFDRFFDIEDPFVGAYRPVSGSYAKTDLGQDKRYRYRDLRRDELSRSATFPKDIDPAQVLATFDRGMLKIAIPSLRTTAAQKVAIN